MSTKRREELQSIFDFVDLERTELIHYVPTKWLSVTPAVKILILNKTVLRGYFHSIDDCPNFFSDLIQSKNAYHEVKLLVLINFD